MKKKIVLMAILSVVLMMVLVTTLSIGPQRVEATNGSYHASMTHDVLTAQGFADVDANLATVGNLLVDVYSSLPDIVAFFTRGPWPSEGAPFHCDNLFTLQDVQDYWTGLEAAAKSAFQSEAAKTPPDYELMLLMMGVVTHTVQDFYAHSNWIDLWSTRGYMPSQVPTWEDAQDAIKNDPNSQLAKDAQAVLPEVHTGAWDAPNAPQGAETHDQLNKDAANSLRGSQPWPGMTDGTTLFSGSLDVAKRATERWKLKIKCWLDAINPNCWGNLKTYKNTDPDYIKKVADELAELQELMTATGKWTTNQPLDYQRMADAYSAWKNRFASQMNKILRKLFKGFRTNNPMNKYLSYVGSSTPFYVASGQSVNLTVPLLGLATAKTEEIELLTGSLPQGLELNWDPLAGVVVLSGSTSAPPGTTTTEFEGLGRRRDVLVRLSVTVSVSPPGGVGGIVEFPQIEEPGTATPDLSEHNYGALAGIIAGAIAGATALISAAWYIRRRRTKAT